MKTSSQLLLLSVLSALPAVAAAADSPANPASPDTSQWKCESCKFEDGQSGALEVGAASVSDKRAKFGEYTGLNVNGYFIGGGAARYRRADGTYWNVDASNLGLTSRSVDAEGGQQGKYKLRLNYDELPHFISDNAQTPFAGNGSASLTLPAGFPAPTTGSMPLAGTLQTVELDTKRKRLGAGGSWNPMTDWEYSVNFRHEDRDGTKRTAGAFFVNSAQLVEPVDYATDQVDASASYTGGKLQAKFAYYGSTFRNSNNSLTWQNPFTSVVPGDAFGQLALPPDNQFHQILASAGYQLTERTRVTADVAAGRMTQNEGFLPATLNPNIAQVLPASSLDGRADTLNANLKLTSALSSRLRLNASFTHDERDNKTSQNVYPIVSTDMFVGTRRTNLPYTFKQEKLKVSADYRFSERINASAGVDSDSTKRTFQEANKTREDTAWGKIRSRLLDNLDISLKVAHGERRNSGYQAVPGITPPENPLLRKFYMADRRRDGGGLRADIAALENLNIGLGVEAYRDDYQNSAVGLLNDRDVSVNGDVTWRIAEQTSLQLFANHERIKSRQAGSQSFSTPDWSGDNRDTVDVIGIGVKHTAIPNKFDVGADYTVSRSRSEISVNTGVNDPPFPDLFASLNVLKLYATYRLKENLALNAGYWHEFYTTRNWMLDAVAPNTIPNVLTLGEQPPRYNVNVLSLSLRYSY